MNGWGLLYLTIWTLLVIGGMFALGAPTWAAIGIGVLAMQSYSNQLQITQGRIEALHRR